jgi:hypothetical protein
MAIPRASLNNRRVHREKRFSVVSVISVVCPSLVAALWLFGSTVFAQTENYKARLSPVPVENSRAGITGMGSATAALTGRSLTVRGTFEGMQTAVTIAQIHLGPRGVRGPVMFDLTVTKGTPGAGAIAGTFTLTPEQAEAVRSSRFYVQIHSEKAPAGNLWGWLLPVEPQRTRQ